MTSDFDSNNDRMINLTRQDGISSWHKQGPTTLASRRTRQSPAQAGKFSQTLLDFKFEKVVK